MSTKMDIENQNSRLLSYGLLASNIVLLVITIILFIKFPPPVDIYNDYDYAHDDKCDSPFYHQG